MLNSAVFRSDISEQEAEKAMDEKKAEITRCSFSQTCSSPGAPELHECRYVSSLIQFLLDYMHIRNALTPELDRSGIDKVDREVIRFFFEKVRKEAGLLAGSDRDMAELQGNPLIREILFEQEDIQQERGNPSPHSGSFYTVLAKLWMDYLGAAADEHGSINKCERRHFYSLSCLARLARCAADKYLS